MGDFIKRNLQNYVNIACNFALQENVQRAATGDLMTVPDFCFAAFLLFYRDKVADVVASRHPKFAEPAALIKKNAQEYKNIKEAIHEEILEVNQFYQDPEFQNDPDYLVLVLATHSFYFNDHEAIMGEMKNVVAKLEEVDDLLGYSNILMAEALWFMDYEGYRDAVMAAYPAKKAEFEAQNKPGYIQRNWETLVVTGLGMADAAEPSLTEDTLPSGFMRQLLNQRVGVAQDIAKRHPEFSDVVSLMIQNMQSVTPQTNIADMLSGELMAIYAHWDKEEWRSEPELEALYLAYACWAFSGKENDEQTRSMRQDLFRDLDSREQLPVPARIMLMIALWFENYNGYQAAVREKLTPYLQEKILNDVVEKANRQEEQRKAWRAQSVCQYCGGAFTGLIGKKCTKCGRKKDY